MHVAPYRPDPLPIRTPTTAQVAALRRRVDGSDELLRVLAELSFGARSDDFTPIMPAPTGAIR